MKKHVIILLSIALSAQLTKAQPRDEGDHEPNISFCSLTKSHSATKYAEVVKCTEITSPIKELTIKSFDISFLTPSKEPDGKPIFVQYRCAGNKLSNDALQAIKSLEAKKIKRLIIESVLAVGADGTTQQKIAGMVIDLE